VNLYQLDLRRLSSCILLDIFEVFAQISTTLRGVLIASWILSNQCFISSPSFVIFYGHQFPLLTLVKHTTTICFHCLSLFQSNPSLSLFFSYELHSTSFFQQSCLVVQLNNGQSTSPYNKIVIAMIIST
jgi:hypothetical protein